MTFGWKVKRRRGELTECGASKRSKPYPPVLTILDHLWFAFFAVGTGFPTLGFPSIPIAVIEVVREDDRAGRFGRTGAGATLADIGHCARIAVVAITALIHRCHLALAARGLAGVFGAGGVRGDRAGDDGGWVKHTFVRHLIDVADKRAVAEVAVFFARAVGRGIAFACLRSGLACAVLTNVIHGARVAVVTGLAVHGRLAVLAPQRFVTDVQCAFLAIVAVQRSCAYALATLADIQHGAHRAIVAIGVVWSEDAAAGRDAGVVGADIAVVALDTLARADAVRALVVGSAGIAVIASATLIHRLHLAVAS